MDVSSKHDDAYNGGSSYQSSGRGGNRGRSSNGFLQPSWASKVLVFLLIVTAVLLIVTMAVSLVPRSKKLVKEDQYQAVFLTNGQVYFGKLSGVNNRYVVLKDIYYLQEDRQVQPGQNQENQQPSVKLTKLGNELHGPEDEMYIDNDKVIFWENLKSDGKIVQAINGNAQQ